MNIKELIFKKAKEIDFPLLFELDIRAFNRPFDTAFKNVAELTELLKDKNNTLVFSNNLPVGYYSYGKTGINEAEIVGVVVIPEYQKQGIGSIMVKKVLKILKKDVKKIKIVAHPENVAALNLYKKFNFRKSHIDPHYYGTNEPRVVMYFENNPV